MKKTSAKSFIQSMPIAKVAGIATVAIIILFIGIRAISSNSSSNKTQQATNSNKKSIKTTNLDYNMDIPLGDDEEKVINLSLVDAQLKDEIILKGQPAKAVEGKTFLIINIKLANEQEERVKINTRDYLRLSVNDSEDRLAPNVHNDPVEVQPISNQFTRVAFSVFKTDSNYRLYAGEISEEKTEISLDF